MAASTDLVPVASSATACTECSSGVQADGAGVIPFPRPRYEVNIEKDVRIQMSDGIGLYADIYRPQGVDSRLPTILIRTPYSKAPYQERHESAAHSGVAYMFAGQGFAVVVQDVRGRYSSEGPYHILLGDVDDGYETISWITSQHWSNGKVGGFGCSALGIAQIMMSQRRPPGLAAIVPQGASGSMRNMPYDFQPDNLPRFSRWFRFLRDNPTWGSQPPNTDIAAFVRTLPIADMTERSGGYPNDWRDWTTHAAGEPWWDRYQLFDKNSRPDVAALHVNSWFDPNVGDQLDLFNAFQEQSVSERSRRNQYIIISPTSHCQTETNQSPYVYGERNFGDVRQDYWGLYLRWYEHWLYGRPGGLNLPHVQYYLMGANLWKSSDSWPLPGTRFVPYFMTSGGNANTGRGDGELSTVIAKGPPDRYKYDPADPVPGDGGPPIDQRPVDQRLDRLVYKSKPLKEGMEVTGPLRAVLYISSSAVDTDFFVQLNDIYPDGRVYPIQMGLSRARYREAYKESRRYLQDYTRPEFLAPGKIYRVDINMQATGYWFGPGHRIAVQVSSSLFPSYARNLNTGGDNTQTEMKVAENVIYHDADHPSHVLLPVVPN
ncbi:CocE/NonD family hydrolase [Phyllobacterium zundukense]|uniref:CocE/NonD family hydrolase n=1 Tax=Phyllobacterium zundukense TaxID=1867719 RepID=A0ACD4CVM7_9HYPH|nr:CocE/NonD family hydrolase [Phyllobacterium zundukense]UXN57635.1 CocE/NonD family hydrolase [Phyllobacterium zundukense]